MSMIIELTIDKEIALFKIQAWMTNLIINHIKIINYNGTKYIIGKYDLQLMAAIMKQKSYTNAHREKFNRYRRVYMNRKQNRYIDEFGIDRTSSIENGFGQTY